MQVASNVLCLYNNNNQYHLLF